MTGAARAAIVGLGMTELGRVYDRTVSDFAAEAVRRAVADAGLSMSDVDGLLVSSGLSERLTLSLARDLQMGDLRLASEMQAFGSTAGIMVGVASQALEAGTAETVVCVFADAPLKQGVPAGAAYRGRRSTKGVAGLLPAAGLDSTTSMYGLAARRHMLEFGTTVDDFAAVAVAQRAWAAGNPLAQMRQPLSVEQHQASRMIADPLRLLDCCLVSNGAVAIVITSVERARDLAQPPVYVHGFAQCHPRFNWHRDSDFGLVSGAATSGRDALAMASMSVGDIDVAELYDCYTFTTLLTLEDYGFCGKGEGGAFVSSGATAPGGALAVNTGGGQLSSYYMWGMTPMSEAVIQARRQGGARQAPRTDALIVSGNGGILQHHSTVVLSPHQQVAS